MKGSAFYEIKKTREYKSYLKYKMARILAYFLKI